MTTTAAVTAAAFAALPAEALPGARNTDPEQYGEDSAKAHEAVRRAASGATDAELYDDGLPSLAEVRVTSSRWTGERTVTR